MTFQIIEVDGDWTGFLLATSPTTVAVHTHSRWAVGNWSQTTSRPKPVPLSDRYLGDRAVQEVLR